MPNPEKSEPPLVEGEEYEPPGLLALVVIRGSILGVMLVCVLLLGEFATALLFPQNLSGSWRESGPRGVLYNRRDHAARHQFGDRIAHYRINSDHLRGGEIRPEAIKVLFLGDSYTFGWLLDEEYSYVKLLGDFAERDLSDIDYQFLNGGAGGWGLADELAMLEDQGERIEPQVVVQFLNFDHVRRSAVRGLYKLKNDSTLELEALDRSDTSSRLKKFMNSLVLYDWFLEHSHLLQIARDAAIRILVKPSSSVGGAQVEAESAIRLMKGLYRRMNRWCKDHDARLLVVTTGLQHHFYREALQANKVASVDSEFAKSTEEFFASEGIPFEDTTVAVESAMGGRIEDFLIPLDHHVTEAGAMVIAEQAWPFLRRQLDQEMARPPESSRIGPDRIGRSPAQN